MRVKQALSEQWEAKILLLCLWSEVTEKKKDHMSIFILKRTLSALQQELIYLNLLLKIFLRWETAEVDREIVKRSLIKTFDSINWFLHLNNRLDDRRPPSPKLVAFFLHEAKRNLPNKHKRSWCLGKSNFQTQTPQMWLTGSAGRGRND